MHDWFTITVLRTHIRKMSRTLLYYTTMLVLTLNVCHEIVIVFGASKLILQQLKRCFSNLEIPRFKNICLRCHSALTDKENKNLNHNSGRFAKMLTMRNFYEKLSSHFSFDWNLTRITDTLHDLRTFLMLISAYVGVPPSHTKNKKALECISSIQKCELLF
jgi:hypothetical protein